MLNKRIERARRAAVAGITSVRWWMPDNVIYYFDDGNVSNTECAMGQTVLYPFAVNATKKAGF